MTKKAAPQTDHYNKAEKAAIAAVEKALGYTFQKPARILVALTHSSAGETANSGHAARNLKTRLQGEDYERLEFLGDRVVNLVVADLLFRAYPDEREGDLARRHTAFVRGEALAKAACRLNVQSHIRLSASEKSSGGAQNENILADVLEALMAALYLDGGYQQVYSAVQQVLGAAILEMEAPPIDPKTELQEWTQARRLGIPDYKLESRTGPDHAPQFIVSVRIPEGKNRPAYIAKGAGTSKRIAEKTAASAMMKLIQTTIADA